MLIKFEFNKLRISLNMMIQQHNEHYYFEFNAQLKNILELYNFELFSCSINVTNAEPRYKYTYSNKNENFLYLQKYKKNLSY